MKQMITAGLLVALIACTNDSQQKSVSKLTTHQDTVSYSIGMDIGGGMKRQELDINPDLLVQGFRDSFSGSETKVEENTKQKVLRAYQMEIRQKQQEIRKKLTEENKMEGEKFLAENAKHKDIVVQPSGLQYKVIKMGDGPIPEKSDMVEVHYHGTLLDGTTFDSSYDKGKPAKFRVTGVIKGWTEALQMMPVGSKWELFIPSDLAYGERGSRVIEPNSTLIFELELLGIEK
ncbi:MAG: FKBP-type peptidyl-prolyl cis-trans isomerase [Candidatus Marinimicrobia bacterium]|nr:FKBP-type peptidyl-prolyl cis-trans isomerase [Candidatus Neomarinimicrobiota bacterium]